MITINTIIVNYLIQHIKVAIILVICSEVGYPSITSEYYMTNEAQVQNVHHCLKTEKALQGRSAERLSHLVLQMRIQYLPSEDFGPKGWNSLQEQACASSTFNSGESAESLFPLWVRLTDRLSFRAYPLKTNTSCIDTGEALGQHTPTCFSTTPGR